jgi:N-(2-amino-2-carboxyethyl)-L-glutamate synthase
MIVASAFDATPSYSFPIAGLVSPPVYVKCEALNVTGSIKLKPALRMIGELERSGRLGKGGTLIESSSGNLGVAISMVAAARGYRFICVTDPNASTECVKMMRAVGSEVIVVDKKDTNNGYLGTRIALIHEMCQADPNICWVNQYANAANQQAHFHTTAPEILADFPAVDFLFVGTGTTGTLMGCAEYFRVHSPTTRVIAVDAEGSVTFGGPSKSRWIPGIGTSRRPELLDHRLVDTVIHVPEPQTIRMCRQLASRGLLLGGSAGAVLAGVQMFGPQIRHDDTVVAIMPDLGTKYLDTVYCDTWVESHFGTLDARARCSNDQK